VSRTETELLRILANAHRRLDERGVPRVHHPITTEDENSDR
jgi:hypothetical protein